MMRMQTALFGLILGGFAIAPVAAATVSAEPADEIAAGIAAMQETFKAESRKACSRPAEQKHISLPSRVIDGLGVDSDIKKVLGSVTYCLESGVRIYIRPQADVTYSWIDSAGKHQTISVGVLIPTSEDRSPDELILTFPDGTTRAFPHDAILTSPAPLSWYGVFLRSSDALPRQLVGSPPDYVVP